MEIQMETEQKKVGFLLGVGILLFPLIFAWFTLRQGYSTFARVVSFVWLILSICFAFMSTNNMDYYYSMVKINTVNQGEMTQNKEGTY
jgi:hypothetical protein